VRERAQNWRELLIDIKWRGLEIAPDLAIGDGALGFWKAIEEVFPVTRHQRCWVHIAGRDPRFQRGARSPPGQVPVGPVAWGQAWRGNLLRRSRPDT
jgi:Transposase, Mutator family